MGTPRGNSTNLTNHKGTALEAAISGFLQEKGFSASSKTPLYYGDQVGRCFLDGMHRQGVLTVEAITPPALRAYIAEQQAATYVRGGVVKPLSRGSVRQRQLTAKTFLKWCVNQEIIAVSPMDKVMPVKKVEPDRVGFTAEEERRLTVEAANGFSWLAQRDSAIVALLLSTGMRAGGLVPTLGIDDGGLTEDDFDWTRSRVKVTEKGTKTRYLELGKKTTALVKTYIKVRPRTSQTDKLFLSQRGGGAFEYSALSSMLKNIGKYAKIEGNCTAHRFRHTYAANHYRKYHDIYALKENLGHTKIETTMTYLRSLGVDDRKTNYAPPEDW